jgi:phage-related protein/predicted XRE-type DNA-binding protein
VRDEIGAALSVAQFGGKHPKAKPWKGAGQSVLEVVEDYRGDTYRALYTVRFESTVYALHAFQKKSPKGISTAKSDVELIRRRVKAAQGITRRDMADVKSKIRVERSSGNVFADLGLKDAAEKKTRVRLAVAINDILRKSHLSQSASAARLGINQPKISALANYRLEGFSVERLMNFLNALGRDVEIVIRRPPSRRTPRIDVTAA